MAEMQPIPPDESGVAGPSGAYISSRHRLDDNNNGAAKSGGGEGNYLVAGICAIIATILFIAILFMGYTEHREYYYEPATPGSSY